jgi:AraC-like DNA-binding protein
MKNSTATMALVKGSGNEHKDRHKSKFPIFLNGHSQKTDQFPSFKPGKEMKLYIKNMVSLRCKLVVKAELEKLNLKYTKVELGEVEIQKNISDEMRDKLKAALLKAGLEMMDDKRAIIVERVKNVIIEMIHYADELPLVKKSIYISEKLNVDYNILGELFSEVKGISIEQFFIIHKIERAKELIIYNELNLSEIAYKLHYSSVAHLSKQFKKVTGLTPTFFKSLKDKRRIPLENL